MRALHRFGSLTIACSTAVALACTGDAGSITSVGVVASSGSVFTAPCSTAPPHPTPFIPNFGCTQTIYATGPSARQGSIEGAMGAWNDARKARRSRAFRASPGPSVRPTWS